MANKDIIEELKSKLSDSPEENEKFLKAELERFIQEGNNEGIEAASKLILDNMSESQREEIKRLTHVDGVRLDKMYDQIVQLINEKKCVDAKPMAERLYKKVIVEYKEGEKAKFVSLRNPFEENLYQLLFKPEKILNRAPFDFAAYLTAYAYILVETGSPLDAIPVLEQAMEYNQVDCEPKFELAEVYKMLKNKKQLFDITRKTLKVAASPVHIARCYANIGYILTDMGEFDDAAAFYSASIMFAPHPAIPYELREIAQRKGSPVIRPTQEQIMNAMKKYDIEFGPNKDVISVAAQLAMKFLDDRDIYNALKALKLTYNLTHDEEIKKIILKYEPDAAQVVPKPEQPEERRENFTMKVNENPES